MLANNNIVSFDAHHAKALSELSSPNKKIIASCRAILADSLPKCFIFLGNLDDTLFKLADQAKNNIAQSEFFAAMFIFRIQQSDLKDEFIRLVLNDFDDFFSTLIRGDLSKRGFKLAILHNDDLEEEIAITRINTKSNDIFGNEFTLLSRRFGHLIDTKILTKNPLAANNIAARVKDVISPITSNNSVKLQVYKLFEQHTLGELKNLYQALNEELIKNEILPNLAQRKQSQQNLSTPSTTSSADSSPNSSNIMSNESEQAASTRFELQRQILNKEGASQILDSVNIANQQYILPTLAELQQIPFEQLPITQNGSYQLPELNQLLVEDLQTDVQSDSHVDEDTIKIIDLLFEFILGDKIIPAPIRAMIARLRTPMLKVAISDNKFYCTKNHPARRLLNNLAIISTCWDQKRSSQQALIQGKIQTVVTTILTEFDNDISIFKKLNIQLKQFIEQQAQNSAFAEQRIVKENEGQEKLLAAQHEVDSVINDRLSEHSHLPKVVISLINEGLKHILKLRLLQKGLDSPEWTDAVQVLEQLIWSVTPKPDPNDREKLLQTIPHLVKTLESTLSGASFNQTKIRSFFQQLQTCHAQCVNGDLLQQEVLQAIDNQPNVRKIIEQSEWSPIATDKNITPDELAFEKVSALKIGTWIEVSEKDSSHQMKFSWRSHLTDRCLFVCYNGLKAADLSLVELANLFQKGQAKLIDPSQPLMDRALASIMKSINN